MDIEIHIYEDPSVENLNIREIASYLESKLSTDSIDVRISPIENFEDDEEELAEKFARARVRNPKNPKEDFDPLYGEIKFEKDLVQNPSSDVSGVLYDGYQLSKIFRELLPAGELDLSHLHVIFTNRLFGTWDENDNRYHARVSVYGFPSLISTSGIVEAPAKPKEFYREKRKLQSLGQRAGQLEKLKKKFRGEFIEYDDERLTDVMKGYVMQALAYHLTSDPFCDKEYCRLYNAHWQEEVIRAQLEPPEFCEEHEELIGTW